MGYYKNEALTEEYFETINGRRWFHTGDIGEVLANGTLRLIGKLCKMCRPLVRSFPPSCPTSYNNS